MPPHLLHRPEGKACGGGCPLNPQALHQDVPIRQDMKGVADNHVLPLGQVLDGLDPAEVLRMLHAVPPGDYKPPIDLVCPLVGCNNFIDGPVANGMHGELQGIACIWRPSARPRQA